MFFLYDMKALIHFWIIMLDILDEIVGKEIPLWFITFKFLNKNEKK